MLPPVRCFTCGTVLGGEVYAEFKKRVSKGENPEKVLNDLGVKRYCCRKTLLAHVDAFSEIVPFWIY